MAKSWQPPQGWEKRPIAVLGGGVLGMRIAACWTAAGYNVVIRDPSEHQRQLATEYIQANIATYTAITHRQPGSCSATDDLEAAVKDVWLVFEAVPEKLSIKQSTFSDLEKLAPKDALLCTNSSSFKSSEMIGHLEEETKTRVLNTHYMMPPKNMVVELMTDGVTDPAIFPFLKIRTREAGLHPIVAYKESTGFVMNRIWAAIKREVISVIAEGVSSPEEIDRLFVEMYTKGPCRMMDEVGLDTVELIERHYIQERGLPSTGIDFLHNEYVQHGKLGRKTPEKGGWYAPPGEPKLRILVLDSGLATPISINSIGKILKSGCILEMPQDPSGEPIELIGGQQLPDGLEYCYADEHLYWTCMGNPSANDGTILAAKFGPHGLDTDNIRMVVKTGEVHTPKQMVIHQEARKIYFCDREGLRVMRVNTDGSSLETIVKTGNWEDDTDGKDQHKWCVGITVAPSVGKFFWTQKGNSKANQGRIFSANIDMPAKEDASNRTDIEKVMDNLPEPIDLEFDETTHTLYWTDRGELPLGNTLNKKHMPDGRSDGGGLGKGQEILAQDFGEPIGLKIDYDEHVAYVTDLSGHLWKVPLDGSGFTSKEKVYERKNGSFTGLTFIKQK